ncbi:hypothetical protein B0J13DRAFT_127737 [Dactylonectria estremocensis]|uniref:Uncharacterized protein n=1 Tax=Dactylonectria estremocensis TaxID=1079267 RepID=A0A9P9FEY0_9HYPO|nr:hypothetical protein B0J13DRAFT_127737 [Dactylonectria estremocensis]
MSTPEYAVNTLEIAMFFAHEALMTTTATPSSKSLTDIYESLGYNLVKLRQNSIAVIAISILIGLQVLGLTGLVAFLYSWPTWTGYLDAEAMTPIDIQLK